MKNIIGPDFITLLVKDLEKSRKFYSEELGFKASPEVRPHAVAYATKPIGFAIRESSLAPDKIKIPGNGIQLWFKTDNATAIFNQLKERNIPITQELTDGPFGKMFTFCDPDGYQITVHDGG